MITYRQLPPEEFHRLGPVFTESGHKPPHENSLLIAFTAEEGNRIVGMLPVQLAAHIEPLWIHPNRRGIVSWKRLEKMANDFFARVPGSAYYAFAPPSSSVEKMTEISGLKRLPYSVWVKEF